MCSGEQFIETIENGFLERGAVHCIAIILSYKVESESIPIDDIKSPYIISSLIPNDNTNIEVASRLCKRQIFILRYNEKS